MSENRILENDRYIVEVNDFGAELSRIYDKKNKREVLWDANPAGWKRHAPVLFPFVGAVHEGHYHYNGQEIPMTQHGFARDNEFKFVGIQGNTIVHQLTDTEKTRAIYPFSFVLEIRHTLESDGVKVEWNVSNKQNETMYFTIGAHPAFFVPATADTLQKDYKLVFNGQKELSFIQINDTEGTAVYKERKTLPLDQGKYVIGEHLFDNGVLIFDEKQVETIGLEFPNGTPYVTIDCKDYPYVGIWTNPGASFVCLEPWYGRCDNEDFTGELKDKEGVVTLEGFSEFHAGYKINVH